MPTEEGSKMKWSDPVLVQINQRASLGVCNTGTQVIGFGWCENVGSNNVSGCISHGISADGGCSSGDSAGLPPGGP